MAIRKPWTQNELSTVLALYYQIPFGQMHRSNLRVRILANSLGRTPSAIAMKLVNFASLDPAHKLRSVSGLSNVSNLDRAIWEQYHENWESLSNISDSVKYQDTHYELENGPSIIDHTEKMAMQNIRTKQSFFRNVVLSAYCERCCITGLFCRDLLRASHIIPWSVSKEQRLNPQNGLCLNALHDAAFDRGFISISSKFQVILSRQLRDKMPAEVYENTFQKYEGKPIFLPERYFPSHDFLNYHRNNVFLNDL